MSTKSSINGFDDFPLFKPVCFIGLQQFVQVQELAQVACMTYLYFWVKLSIRVATSVINMKCERMNYIAHGQTKSITLQKEREGEEKKSGQVSTTPDQESLMAYLERRNLTGNCETPVGTECAKPLFQTGPRIKLQSGSNA
jgi:hypothetical protein